MPLTAGVRIRDAGILRRTGEPDTVHEVHWDEIWEAGPSIPRVSQEPHLSVQRNGHQFAIWVLVP